MDVLPVLANHTSGGNESEVLAGYAAVAASAVLVILVLIGLYRGRRGSMVAFPVVIVLAVASWSWLSDSWDDWYRYRCIEHRTESCRSGAGGPLPFFD